MSTQRTEKAIAEAAVEYVRARTMAAKFRGDRAAILESGECPHNPRCFYQPHLDFGSWCAICTAARPIHTAYRQAATKRARAFVKLRRLVSELPCVCHTGSVCGPACENGAHHGGCAGVGSGGANPAQDAPSSST